MSAISVDRKTVPGARGVIIHTIERAALDLRVEKHRAAAIAYFYSESYRNHLEALGLPLDWLPEELQHYEQIERSRNRTQGE